LPSGSTIFHQARLSSAVPHSTAFLPPAFMAMLPPMQEAEAEVGSTAKTRPASEAASETRSVTTPAPVRMVAYGVSWPARTSVFDRADVDQLLGVDHRRVGRQRHGAAGVAGAAATRDDGQAGFDAAAHEVADFFLGIRVEDDEGVFDAPVGGIGDVRDAGQAVEGDVVLARVLAEDASVTLRRRS
jgi:hypothetical protein